MYRTIGRFLVGVSCVLVGCAQIIGIQDLPELPEDASSSRPPDARAADASSLDAGLEPDARAADASILDAGLEPEARVATCRSNPDHVTWPDNGSSCCVHMQGNGLWYDEACSESVRFVCECSPSRPGAHSLTARR